MYVRQFLLVSHSYLQGREDARAALPLALPIDVDTDVAAGERPGASASHGTSADNRPSTDRPCPAITLAAQAPASA